MPLSKRTDYADARFAGVATDEPAAVLAELDTARQAGFDFFVVRTVAAGARRQAVAGLLASGGG